MNATKTLAGVSGLLMIVALSSTGCATKKYVRQQTSPIQQRVEEVNKKQGEALASLEGKEQKDVSRVEERAMSAENRANDAARAAQQADQHAQDAAQSAKNATELAQQNQSKLGDLTNAFQNIDSYKMASAEDVLFGFNRATLTPEAQAKLDQLIQQTTGLNRYVLEIEGFTDKTGSKDYNLALSRRRADVVVRYLVDHGVPLRRIHMLGLGAEQQQMEATAAPAAPEQPSRLTRKLQRRVVVRVFTPDSTLSASNTASIAAAKTQPAAQQSQPTKP